MPETRAVRRLQHSAKATAQSFHSSRPISVINLPPQVVVTVYSLMKGRWGALSEYLRLFGAQCGQGLSCMISQGLLRSWFSTASMPYDESGGLADFCSSAVDTDSYAASLVMSDGESVYDYCWYPICLLQVQRHVFLQVLPVITLFISGMLLLDSYAVHTVFMMPWTRSLLPFQLASVPQGLNKPVNYDIRKKRYRAQSCKATFELPFPQPKKLSGECTVRRETRSSQNILRGSTSGKHYTESRFLFQIESSSR